MTHRRLTDHELERGLRTLASEVEYPPTPDVAATIRRRLDESPPPRRSWIAAGSRWRPALVTITIAVVAFASVVALSPTTRDAIADFVGLDDIRIGFDDGPTPSIPANGPDLGRPVTLAEAERELAFEVKVPALEGLGRYTTYVTRPPADGMASLHYPAAFRTEEPPGLLITQFEADLDGAFFKKLSIDDATVEYLTVRGHEGYWLEGVHLFYYLDASEELRTETLRLADNVLLWEEDGIVYRIEGGFGRAVALRLAGALRD